MDNNKISGFLAKLILVAVYLYTVFFTYFLNSKSDGYILGDWLINYQDGGFKRRGLSGSFFFFLQDVTGLNLHILVFLAQFCIITAFFVLVWVVLKSRVITLPYLSLMVSALGFVGLLNSIDYAGKKEFILFLIFIMYAYLIVQNKLSQYKENLILIFLFCSVFLHEIVVFFIPYFVLAHYFVFKQKPIYYLKYFVAVGVPAVLIYAFGGEINEGQSLLILRDRGVVFTKGIFFWDAVDEKAVLRIRLNEFFMYFIGALLSMMHVALYIKIKAQQLKHIGWFLLAAFLYSLPLFYLGLDWGRWYYIHMMMIILLFSIFLLNKKTYEKNDDLKKKEKLIFLLIILLSLIYRVELSGLFTFEGLFYRVFLAPMQLWNKIL